MVVWLNQWLQYVQQIITEDSWWWQLFQQMIIAVDGQRSATVIQISKKKKKQCLTGLRIPVQWQLHQDQPRHRFFFLPGRREIVVGHCQCQDWASPTIMYIYIFSFIIEDKQWKLKLPTASSHQPSILLSQNWLLATFWISFGYLLSSWDNDGCSRESHITCCILLHTSNNLLF